MGCLSSSCDLMGLEIGVLPPTATRRREVVSTYHLMRFYYPYYPLCEMDCGIMSIRDLIANLTRTLVHRHIMVASGISVLIWLQGV